MMNAKKVLKKINESMKMNETWYLLNIYGRGYAAKTQSINDIIKTERNCAIEVVVDTKSKEKVFCLGAGSLGYGKIGGTTSYIEQSSEDSGDFKIENEIIVKDGKIVNNGNGIGLNEKRPVWVFK